MDSHTSATSVQNRSRLDQVIKRKIEETGGYRTTVGLMPSGPTNGSKRKWSINTRLGHRPRRVRSSGEEDMKSTLRSPIEDCIADQRPASRLGIPAPNSSMVPKDDSLLPNTNFDDPEVFFGRRHAGEISDLPPAKALELSTIPPAPPPNQKSAQECQTIRPNLSSRESYQEYRSAQYGHPRTPELDCSLSLMDYHTTKAHAEYPSVLGSHQSSSPDSDQVAWNSDATSFIPRRDSSPLLYPHMPGSRVLHGCCYSTVHELSSAPPVIPGFPQPAIRASTGWRVGEYQHWSASSGLINDFTPWAVTGVACTDDSTSDRQLAACHVTPSTISHQSGNVTAAEGSRLNSSTSVVRLTDPLSPPPRSPAISSIRGDFGWVEQRPSGSAGLAVLADDEAPPHPVFSDDADKQLPGSRDGDHEGELIPCTADAPLFSSLPPLASQTVYKNPSPPTSSAIVSPFLFPSRSPLIFPFSSVHSFRVHYGECNRWPAGPISHPHCTISARLYSPLSKPDRVACSHHWRLLAPSRVTPVYRTSLYPTSILGIYLPSRLHSAHLGLLDDRPLRLILVIIIPSPLYRHYFLPPRWTALTLS